MAEKRCSSSTPKASAPILAIKQEQRELTDNARDLGFGIDSAVVNKDLTDLENRLKAIADEEARILKILEGRKPTALAPIPEGEAIDTSRSQASRDKAAQAAIREAEAVKALIADLQFEREQVGLTDLEKRTNETLRRAGAAATAEEREQIRALVAEIERETEALKANEQAQEARKQAIEGMFQMGADALTSMVDGSMKAEEALKRLIVQLALAAAQAALLGTGPLAGFVPSIFKADGGVVQAASGGFIRGPGGPRDDKIPARLSNGEYVINARQTAKHRALLDAINQGKITAMRDGGPVGVVAPQFTMPKLPSMPRPRAGSSDGRNVNITINVEGANGDEHVVKLVRQGVQQGLQTYDREIAPHTVNRVIRDPYAMG